jgi:hypothetical protein
MGKKLFYQKNFSMSLQHQSIRCMRANLLRTNTAEGFRKEWHAASIGVGAGDTGNGDYETQCRRDVLAYTLINVMHTAWKLTHFESVYIYGGFIAAHHSGLPWNDLDCVIYGSKKPESHIRIVEFLQHCIRQLSFILSIPTTDIRFRRIGEAQRFQSLKSGYANKFEIEVVGKSVTTPISLPIDITIPCCRYHNDSVCVDGVFVDTPATIGSCLKWPFTCNTLVLRTEIRPDVNAIVKTIPVEDIVALLQNGMDILLGLSRSPEQTFPVTGTKYLKYHLYCKTKVEKKRLQGWDLSAKPVGYPLAGIEAIAQAMSREHVILAASSETILRVDAARQRWEHRHNMRMMEARQREEWEAQRATEEAQRATEEAQRAAEEAQRATEEAQRATEEAQRARAEAERAREAELRAPVDASLHHHHLVENNAASNDSEEDIPNHWQERLSSSESDSDLDDAEFASRMNMLRDMRYYYQ